MRSHWMWATRTSFGACAKAAILQSWCAVLPGRPQIRPRASGLATRGSWNAGRRGELPVWQQQETGKTDPCTPLNAETWKAQPWKARKGLPVSSLGDDAEMLTSRPTAARGDGERPWPKGKGGASIFCPLKWRSRVRNGLAETMPRREPGHTARGPRGNAR